MYNNLYYNPQASIDRINTQMGELERMKEQLQKSMQPTVPTNLTQNFQLAPTAPSAMRYANSLDEVQKEMVLTDTAYFSKDLSIVWVKNNKGEIKTYELREIIQKDDKDLKIDYLMAQIEELKKGMINNECNANVNGAVANETKEQEPTNVSTVSKSNAKSK